MTANGSHLYRSFEQCTGFRVVDCCEKVKRNRFFFVGNIKKLSTNHAERTSCLCQQRDQTEPNFRGRTGKPVAADQLKSICQQTITSKNGLSFAKLSVAGRLTSAEVVVVHCRQIVMNQRIGMNALQGAGSRQELERILAMPRRDRERWLIDRSGRAVFVNAKHSISEIPTAHQPSRRPPRK